MKNHDSQRHPVLDERMLKTEDLIIMTRHRAKWSPVWKILIRRTSSVMTQKDCSLDLAKIEAANSSWLQILSLQGTAIRMPDDCMEISKSP